MDLEPMEREALDRLLDREGATFGVLRRPALVTQVATREFTGVGFFASLAVAPDAPRLAAGTHVEPLTGVHADMVGLRHGAGFVLFVEDGALATLEGFTYSEPWPESHDGFTFSAA